jgi:SAM-dependent methyltransferase
MSNMAWEAEYWNGEAAARWVEHQVQMDRALEPFGDAVLRAARLNPGMSVLDVGCGCGQTSIAAAHSVGQDGHVTGIDISRPMIERARVRAYGLHHLTFVCADASVFGLGRRFDALISRNGLMFFKQATSALRHLRAQLRIGASMSFCAWRRLEENEWLHVPLKAVIAATGLTQPSQAPDTPGPFGFAREMYIRELLNETGFGEIQVRPFEAQVRISDAGVAAAVHFVKLHAGPVGRLLNEVDSELRAKAELSLADHLSKFESDSGVELRGAAWLVSATAR